ncbi:MAG: DUF1592 domain-containing protein [Myxococcales bacterium]|nr:MAG: DUF1592 domain-containing protein [Myxococcales bacterium]
MPTHLRYSYVLCLWIIGGCVGVIGSSEANNNKVPSDALSRELSELAWLRLTNAQYDNTLRDLLGYEDSFSKAFPDDEYVNGFELAGNVTTLSAEQLSLSAEKIAEQAVQDIPGLLKCDPTEIGERQCVEQFVDDFVMRAFRRPVESSEKEALLALYDETIQAFDFSSAVQVMVETVLQSSAFLYRSQQGVLAESGAQSSKLNNWEMASRLSYFLWNTMPDEPLFAAAEAGELQSQEQVVSQAERMLDDPKAKEGVADLFRQWLHWDKIQSLAKDSSLYPDFDQDFASMLQQSVVAYVNDVFFDQDARLETLFTSPVVFANARLAASYEFEAPEGDALSKVELDGQTRFGLLGQPALLAMLSKTDQSDPIHRGVFVRQQILCQQLPPPPNNVVVNIEAPAEGLSTRERFAAHSTDPSCNGCHRLIDPVGFGFEEFGPIGESRGCRLCFEALVSPGAWPG